MHVKWRGRRADFFVAADVKAGRVDSVVKGTDFIVSGIAVKIKDNGLVFGENMIEHFWSAVLLECTKSCCCDAGDIHAADFDIRRFSLDDIDRSHDFLCRVVTGCGQNDVWMVVTGKFPHHET